LGNTLSTSFDNVLTLIKGVMWSACALLLSLFLALTCAVCDGPGGACTGFCYTGEEFRACFADVAERDIVANGKNTFFFSVTQFMFC
jgi:hypothetical protein